MICPHCAAYRARGHKCLKVEPPTPARIEPLPKRAMQITPLDWDSAQEVIDLLWDKQKEIIARMNGEGGE